MQKSKALWVWVLQAVSGMGLIVLLGLHWVAQHYLAGGSRNYAQVVAYLRNPLVFALETAFLITVSGHALLGVRAIMLDLGLSLKQRRVLDIFLCILGGCTVVYGVQLAWQIAH